jgi:hypothetical protein
MDKTSPEYIKEIERMLERKLSAAFVEDFTEAGGLQSAVDILNVVDRATEKHILESLFKEDTGLAEKIRKKMFVFEDLTKLDPRSIQRVIKETDVKVLATALKHAAEEVKNALFDNMSSRMKQNILADLATLRARIQAYINVSNLYKTAQVEYENLKKYSKEVVEKNCNTKYTLNKKTTDPKKDDDFYFGDWDKYFQNKLSVIFKLLEKQGNKGTKNAASQQLRNLQKKFGDSFKVYMEKYLGKDYEEYLEDLFDYKIDDDNDDKDYQKSNKKNNNNNNGKNGKGKND